MKPYDVNLVADYIITQLNSDEIFSLINLKLQKLLYYIQGWSLGISNEKFLNCSFEAWVHGPVCRQLYDRFKTTKNLYSIITPDDRIFTDKDLDFICKEDKEFINYILENYAGFSGAELESMTHAEKPWLETRGDLAPMQACHKEISNEIMKDFFGEKWAVING